MNAKKIAITILKFGISFGILGFLFYQTWQNDQFSVLASSEKKVGWLVLALAVGLATAVTAFLRWYLLVRALDLPFTVRDAIRLGFLGNLLNLMSFGVVGGDALKSIFLARQIPNRVPEAVASVIFDRAIGLLAMFTFASVAYLLTDFSTAGLLHEQANAALHVVCKSIIAITIIGYISLGFVFLSPWFTKTRLYKWGCGVPRIGRIFERLIGCVLVYRGRPGVVAVTFLISILINCGFATAFYSIAAGISDVHPTFAQHLVVSPIAMAANAIPLPGGIGGLEFAVNYLYLGLSNQEIPAEHGFVVALGFRMILVITAGIGLVYYFSSKREISELRKFEQESHAA